MSILHTADAAPQYQGPGVVLNAYLLPGLWTLGGPTGLTGGGLDWLAVTMGYQSAAAAYRALEPALDAADPGDLMIRTTLTGRRLPGWDAGQRGRMEGLSAEHGPVHLLRAAEEGSIFEVRLGIDALRSGGTTVSQVILAGRPATSARAAQLRANAWGIRVGRDSRMPACVEPLWPRRWQAGISGCTASRHRPGGAPGVVPARTGPSGRRGRALSAVAFGDGGLLRVPPP